MRLAGVSDQRPKGYRVMLAVASATPSMRPSTATGAPSTTVTKYGKMRIDELRAQVGDEADRAEREHVAVQQAHAGQGRGAPGGVCMAA